MYGQSVLLNSSCKNPAALKKAYQMVDLEHPDLHSSPILNQAPEGAKDCVLYGFGRIGRLLCRLLCGTGAGPTLTLENAAMY